MGTPRRPSFPPRAIIKKFGCDFKSQSILETPPLVVDPLIPALMTLKVQLLSEKNSVLSFFSSKEGKVCSAATP